MIRLKLNKIISFIYLLHIRNMSRRTYENDADRIEFASDLEKLVTDKRVIWRANSSKINQRQRRYKKRILQKIKSKFKNNNLS